MTKIASLSAKQAIATYVGDRSFLSFNTSVKTKKFAIIPNTKSNSTALKIHGPKQELQLGEPSIGLRSVRLASMVSQDDLNLLCIFHIHNLSERKQSHFSMFISNQNFDINFDEQIKKNPYYFGSINTAILQFDEGLTFL